MPPVLRIVQIELQMGVLGAAVRVLPPEQFWQVLTLAGRGFFTRERSRAPGAQYGRPNEFTYR
jgi:hypothetical protein